MTYRITPRIAAELISHEGIVREAYKDSVGVWTWGIGVTDASGHKVDRYIDNEQTLARVFEIFEWLLREKYMPPVVEAFKGRPLSEEQLGAALSFHYNTGGIKRASWVQSWLAKKYTISHRQFMNWKRPPEIIPRRQGERDLFFDSVWSNDGTTTEYPVSKPSYRPNFRAGRRVHIMPILEDLFG